MVGVVNCSGSWGHFNKKLRNLQTVEAVSKSTKGLDDKAAEGCKREDKYHVSLPSTRTVTFSQVPRVHQVFTFSS